jgi:hypothetical protein
MAKVVGNDSVWTGAVPQIPVQLMSKALVTGESLTKAM